MDGANRRGEMAESEKLSTNTGADYRRLREGRISERVKKRRNCRKNGANRPSYQNGANRPPTQNNRPMQQNGANRREGMAESEKLSTKNGADYRRLREGAD